MSTYKCLISVRVEVLVQEMLPPPAISGSFPGWVSWNAGGQSRAALCGFVRSHLEICAAPENLLDPSVVESPDDSQMFPMQLESVRDGVAILVAEVPFAFSRRVRQSDLDHDSEFSDECGSIAGIFSVHWKIGEGEYDEGFQDSENFSVRLRRTTHPGAGGES